jgi:Protein of unknown function (DUF559)
VVSTEEKIELATRAWIEQRRSDAWEATNSCESPIERLLVLAMLMDRTGDHSWAGVEFPPNFPEDKKRGCSKAHVRASPLAEPVPRWAYEVVATPERIGYGGGSFVGGTDWYGLGNVLLWLQPNISAGGKTYRADLAFVGKHTRLIVEADGHDFHERTKAQARHDKSRDRALQAAGWRVMRFTGSEIYADANRCAHEVAIVLSLDDYLHMPPVEVYEEDE